MADKSCRVCGVLTFPQTAPPEVKAALKAEGRKRQCGRGVCVNCYERYRKAGRIDELALRRGVVEGDVDEAKVCDRCGIKHRAPGTICNDCVIEVEDLGEVELWVSA